MSTFVKLDYSERERWKMLDVVDLFREHDARDELDIGSVQRHAPIRVRCDVGAARSSDQGCGDTGTGRR